jgi:hypothetical protein
VEENNKNYEHALALKKCVRYVILLLYFVCGIFDISLFGGSEID